jgi:hypothetical protein
MGRVLFLTEEKEKSLNFQFITFQMGGGIFFVSMNTTLNIKK